jgi:inner membrane protease ATP23
LVQFLSPISSQRPASPTPYIRQKSEAVVSALCGGEENSGYVATAMASSGATPPSTPAAVPKTVADAPSDANPSSRPRQMINDASRTGFDPETKWWMNYFKILTNQMTPEGKFHYREWRYKVHEERDCKRCEEYKDWLFTYSPAVRFLSDKIQDLNGKLDHSNIHCRRCPSILGEDGTVNRQAGGFDPNHGILICANEMRDRKHMEDTVAHEMVHAWDHLRWKMDWTGDKDLKHAACTEVSLPTHSAIYTHTHTHTHARAREVLYGRGHLRCN